MTNIDNYVDVQVFYEVPRSALLCNVMHLMDDIIVRKYNQQPKLCTSIKKTFN